MLQGKSLTSTPLKTVLLPPLHTKWPILDESTSTIRGGTGCKFICANLFVIKQKVYRYPPVKGVRGKQESVNW